MKAIKVIYADGTAKYTLDRTEEILKEMHKEDRKLIRRMLTSLSKEE